MDIVKSASWFAAAAALAGLSLIASAELAPAARPGGRVLLDAHNAYPDGDSWADRIDRALATGVPLAIEQDLVWYHDPARGPRSIVSHGEPFTGREPSLETYFFERVRPMVEQALSRGDREQWPLIVLNLDLKTNEPEHHAAIWKTLGKYEEWLTTAERTADPSRVMPWDVKPILVLTGNSDAQQVAFHDRVPIGPRLRLFGAIPTDVEGAIARRWRQARTAAPPAGDDAQRRREAIAKLVELTPEELIASGPTNYRRWTNHPWAVVERGGQQQAGDWTPADRARLEALVSRAHALGLWIRFYTLNGHSATGDRGWSAGYNFGDPAAVDARWRAAIDAGVDFVATDQYEALASVLGERRRHRKSGIIGSIPFGDG